MTTIIGIHHVAIICSDYEKAKNFYTNILELPIIRETYRSNRGSYKLDLSLADGSQLELFSFPSPPVRLSRPEACGLRHLAFAVKDITAACGRLSTNGVQLEDIRLDELTGRRFVFFSDPDGLPIELYEIEKLE